MMPSGRPLHWEEMHYRLVSLWDLIMHVFEADKFLAAYTLLISFSTSIRNWEEGHDKLFDPQAEGNRSFIEDARCLHRQLSELGLLMSAKSAERVLHCLENGLPLAKIHRRIKEMHGRIGDELQARTLLVVPTDKEALYRQAVPPFGSNVDAAFKRNGRWEISEAAKCLTLGRPTACVFHLMRAVEVALEAVALCLQLPPPRNRHDKTWGAVLGRFQEELDGRENLTWPRQWSSAEDKRTFAAVHASLIAIKDAWRDPTMHLESTYDDDGAQHLWAVVKGFMQKVASRLDEDGQPLA